MKKIVKTNKFNTFYYIGLSFILGVLFLIFISMSVISGLIIGHFSKNDNSVNKIENTTSNLKKEIVYDTIKVPVYDTIKVKPKKIKSVSTIEQSIDSVK